MRLNWSVVLMPRFISRAALWLSIGVLLIVLRLFPIKIIMDRYERARHKCLGVGFLTHEVVTLCLRVAALSRTAGYLPSCLRPVGGSCWLFADLLMLDGSHRDILFLVLHFLEEVGVGRNSKFLGWVLYGLFGLLLSVHVSTQQPI